jgi:ceramide glucosyltransferase
MRWELLGAALAVWAVASHVAATVVSRRFHRRARRATKRALAVSVLKPLRGVDDCLEQNLETFFALDYPLYEVLFCAADESDPALEVAERVCRRHPEVRARILRGHLPPGLNPKVRLLDFMSRSASFEVLAVSDSNVRVRPEWLRETLAELDDERVGAVSNLIAGVGERTLGATLENLQLNGFVAPAICLGLALGRPPCLVGKSMAVRRAALEAVGGWRALADVLAEDYLLGRLLAARGLRAAISVHVVDTVNETWSFGRFAERHDRWLKMRWRLNPGALVAELLSNVTLMSALWMTLAAGSISALVGGLGCIVARIALEAAATRSLMGGRPTRIARLGLAPLRDLVLATLWVHARLSARIRWRGGERLVIGRGTALSIARTAAGAEPLLDSVPGARAEVPLPASERLAA